MISVVMATYNRENTIIRAVKSVLEQSYRDIELIVVDDASTDGTLGVLEEISDPRMRVIKCDINSGASAARNVGIRAAEGDYITFHDSDDVLLPTKLEEQLRYLQENDLDFVFCQVNRYGLDGSYIDTLPKENEFNLASNKFTFLLQEGIVWTQAAFGKALFIKDVVFDTSFPCRVDWEWSLRIAQKARMGFQNKAFVDSYIQKNSISQVPQKEVKALMLMREKYSKWIDSENEMKKIWDIKIANAKFYANDRSFIPCMLVFLKYHKFAYLAKAFISLPLIRKCYFLIRK